MSAAARSVGPKNATTACTLLDCSAHPPSPSRPSSFCVTPSIIARCAPAEKPHTRDAVGVEAVLVGVGAQEADGALHVVHLRGKPVLRRQAVADGRGDVTRLGHPPDVVVVGRAVAADHAAAVDEDDAGQPFRVGRGPGDVELEVFAAALAVDDVAGERGPRPRGGSSARAGVAIAAHEAERQKCRRECPW